MHNLANEPTRNNGHPSTEPVIYVSRFQPFESRRGRDYVLRLDFDYDPALIAQIKRLLAGYKADAVNPALRRLAPGGWLPEYRCWFLEPCIWEAVRLELEFSGYHIREVTP
jgi:hypothetical protein